MTDGATRLSDYSLLDPATQSDPFDLYALLHRECPVYRMPETDMYVITRYETLRQVLKDSETFSNDPSRAASRGLQRENQAIHQDMLAARGWAHVQTLQRTDPPVHNRYRKLLDRVFTAKRVRDMAGDIEALAHSLVDRFAARGTCEFIDEFAMPLPGIIIAEQLGLDRRDVRRFKRWADAMLAMAIRVMTPDQIREVTEIELEAQHFLAGEFEKRRREPTGDLMSALVHAHGADEEPLSMPELQNLMHQLITGGFETTQSAIAHAVWLLVRQPELQHRLFEAPELIRDFVEESLRWESPVQGLARVTTREIELDGTRIPKNALLIVRYGAANRDPQKFACPHMFDLDRKNAGAHLAFGSGAHFCVGAMLAREEMQTAVRVLTQRLRDIRLARPLPDPVHQPSLFFLPIADMHLEFAQR